MITNLKSMVEEWVSPGHPGYSILKSASFPLRLCIFDGFLLYSPSVAAVQQYMDVNLFLRVSYAKAKARREARSGYATIEGFWQDPPGYVDKIVWPNYVRDHRWMFENNNVEGNMKEDVINMLRIHAQLGKGPDVNMETTLKWAVETLIKELEEIATK